MSVPYRLALRAEGPLWNAYFAKGDTLDGAVFLGSIMLKLVEDEGRKQRFMELMRDSMHDLLSDLFDIKPDEIKWGDEQSLKERLS